MEKSVLLTHLKVKNSDIDFQIYSLKPSKPDLAILDVSIKFDTSSGNCKDLKATKSAYIYARYCEIVAENVA